MEDVLQKLIDQLAEAQSVVTLMQTTIFSLIESVDGLTEEQKESLTAKIKAAQDSVPEWL